MGIDPLCERIIKEVMRGLWGMSAGWHVEGVRLVRDGGGLRALPGVRHPESGAQAAVGAEASSGKALKRWWQG
jgi:hypothetical protein